MKVARTVPGSVLTRIAARLRRRGRGVVIVPRDVLDLGSRQAVDAAIGRLVDQGVLRRLARGVYDYPRRHPRFGLRTPSVDAVAKAIARSTGESICVSGAKAANVLGVSTQVPAQALFLTDGTSRTIRVDLGGGRGFDVRFKRSTRRQGGDTRPGLVLRALGYLGKDGVDDGVLKTLSATLSDRDKQGLARLKWDAPGWMQPLVAQLVDPGEASREGVA